ncbi:hypothetical protein HGO26_07795 [Shewanella sp. S-1]|uniref:Uncharacterized protein n=1 Tax=Shewanella oncorhynchi TaxID=2726434 RepID=A0ABX1KKS0_9GAMM|nr:hypothetical protein [Shewanella oncorhynchi]NLQ22781.1 hypothetical protein [Shewanella oncorhynchi]
MTKSRANSTALFLVLSVIRYLLSVIRYPLSVIRYPLSVIRYPLSVIQHQKMLFISQLVEFNLNP